MDERPEPDAPTELRTFLVADIRGYTRFTEERGDEAAGRLAAKFASLARQSAEAHGGRVLEFRGDEALAVFGSARQALRAALDLNERCDAASKEDPSLPLTIGIGIDAGAAVAVEGGFRGAALNLAARLCGVAAPGEVLAGEGLVYLARKTEGLTFVEQSSMSFKGFSEPIRVFRVMPEGAVEVLQLPAVAGPSPMTRPLRPPMPYRDQLIAHVDHGLSWVESIRGLGDAIKARVQQEMADEFAATKRDIRGSRERRPGVGPDRQLQGRRRSERTDAPPSVRKMVSGLVMLIVIIVVVALVIHFL